MSVPIKYTALLDILEMKKKVQASRDLFVRLHKANSNACLEDNALTSQAKNRAREESAFKHCKQTQESLKDMNSKQVADHVSSLVRSACDNNELHDAEADSARTAAEM
ncbi:hypothetical protein Rs2_50706 [Raphanus sativus]|nr:hypothetical protein Rs2_50706 [Raphanus sativus]